MRPPRSHMADFSLSWSFLVPFSCANICLHYNVFNICNICLRTGLFGHSRLNLSGFLMLHCIYYLTFYRFIPCLTTSVLGVNPLFFCCVFCLSCTEKGGWTEPASTEWATVSRTAKEAAPGASEGPSHALICSISSCLYFVSLSSLPCRPTAPPPPSRPRRLKTMPPMTWWGSPYCTNTWGFAPHSLFLYRYVIPHFHLKMLLHK